MAINALLALHEKVAETPMGVNREAARRAAEEAALASRPTIEFKGLLR